MAGGLFSEEPDRSMIPAELLRPRREEYPRYPIDTVIGELGRGNASSEAYEFARSIASALVAGSIDAPVLSAVTRVFLEDCMLILDEINPRLFRLGSGRTEPDGSVSFLVRFVGRDYGITGELFVRLVERRPAATPPAAEVTPGETELEPAAILTADELTPDEAERIRRSFRIPPTAQATLEGTVPEPVQVNLFTTADNGEQPGEEIQDTELDATIPADPAPTENNPIALVWVFEDLVFEEALSREEENRDSRLRFDFPPYERFF